MKAMAKTMLPLALLLSTGYSAQAATSIDYDGLHQQMTIMSDIIKTSASNKSGSSAPRISSIDSYYLQGQGAVFNLKVSRGNTFFISRVGGVTPVLPPLPPRAPKGMKEAELFGENYEIIIETALEDAEHSMELAHEQMRMNSEDQRQLREQEREISYELRDIEREKRDLNYQKIHLDESDVADNKKELAELDKRKQALNKSMAKLAQSNKAYQAKMKKSQQQSQQAQQNFYQQLQVSVVDVMCNYGGGLKAIPDKEFINVVIKGAGDKMNQRVKDKVLSFKKSDVKNCVIEKITPKQLLSQANKYQF